MGGHVNVNRTEGECRPHPSLPRGGAKSGTPAFLVGAPVGQLDGRMRPSLRERLLIQRAAAIRCRNVRFQKVSHSLVGVNLIFYF